MIGDARLADPAGPPGGAVQRQDLLRPGWRPGRPTTATDVAIVRVEQLYPLPGDEIAAELARYPDAQLIWAQEEPANQGGYPFMALNLPERLAAHGDSRRLYRASRRASASPAVGSASVHETQQREVVATALG